MILNQSNTNKLIKELRNSIRPRPKMYSLLDFTTAKNKLGKTKFSPLFTVISHPPPPPLPHITHPQCLPCNQAIHNVYRVTKM